MKALLITDKPVRIMVAEESHLGLVGDVLFLPRDAGWATVDRHYEDEWPIPYAERYEDHITLVARNHDVPVETATLTKTGSINEFLVRYVWTWHETTITIKEN